MTILVTGATGKVGRQVVTQLTDQGIDVRALVRDPPTARLPDGVDVVRGDLTDVDSVRAALPGVDKVFLVWPFFGTDGLAEVLAAIAEQTRRLVYLSSSGDTTWAADAEKAIDQAGLRWTFLRPTGFAGNALGFAAEIKAGDVVRAPYPGLTRPLIHERDIAAVGVLALLDDQHVGARYELSGPELLSQVEQVQIIGDAIGRELRFEEISPETAAAEMRASGWPEALVSGAIGAWAEMVERPETITSTVRVLTGAPARTFREWAADSADSFR
ncbi:MAG: NAD(P)H-binding protein [Kibdelosporangium sp.]